MESRRVRVETNGPRAGVGLIARQRRRPGVRRGSNDERQGGAFPSGKVLREFLPVKAASALAAVRAATGEATQKLGTI